MVLKDLPDGLVVCKPCYPHVLMVGKQRSCKDIVLVKDIFTHVRDKRSIFDLWFEKEFLDLYERNVNRVFANCWLDDSYFPGDVSFEFVDSIEQIDGLRDGILYLHDLEMIFNSRGKFSDKDMLALLEIVNNAGKHRVMIRGSCHRNMSVDVKLRSLINLWCEPVPYHTDNSLNSYTVALNIFDCDLVRVGFDVVDGLHRFASLYDTNEESVLLKKVHNGVKPFRAIPYGNP